MPFSIPMFLRPSLPRLPTLAVPVNLHRKLLSYALRRYLGPFLEDGGQSLEREAGLIDADLTRHIQIRDIVADPSALNKRLSGSGLPVDVVAASIGRLDIVIEWPAASWSSAVRSMWSNIPQIRITVEDVAVTFVIAADKSADGVPDDSVTLEASVLDTARSFLAEGLDASEHDQLDRSVVGSDAFISTEALGPGALRIPGGFGFQDEGEAAPAEAIQAQEVGFFAALLQRLLAKVEVAATNISIELRDEASYIKAKSDHISVGLESEVNDGSGITRRIRFAPPRLIVGKWQGARTPESPGHTSSDGTSSSESSMDSRNDMFMSQAIADLRHSTPAGRLVHTTSGSEADLFWSIAGDGARSGVDRLDRPPPFEQTEAPFLAFGTSDIVVDLRAEPSDASALSSDNEPTIKVSMGRLRLVLDPEDLNVLHSISSSLIEASSKPEGPIRADPSTVNAVATHVVLALESAIAVLTYDESPLLSRQSFWHDGMLVGNGLRLALGRLKLESGTRPSAPGSDAPQIILNVQDPQIFELVAGDRHDLLDMRPNGRLPYDLFAVPQLDVDSGSAKPTFVEVSISKAGCVGVVLPALFSDLNWGTIQRVTALLPRQGEAVPPAQADPGLLSGGDRTPAIQRTHRIGCPSVVFALSTNSAATSSSAQRTVHPLYVSLGRIDLELSHKTASIVLQGCSAHVSGHRIVHVSGAVNMNYRGASDMNLRQAHFEDDFEDEPAPQNFEVSLAHVEGELCKASFNDLQYWLDDLARSLVRSPVGSTSVASTPRPRGHVDPTLVTAVRTRSASLTLTLDGNRTHNGFKVAVATRGILLWQGRKEQPPHEPGFSMEVEGLEVSVSLIAGGSSFTVLETARLPGEVSRPVLQARSSDSKTRLNGGKHARFSARVCDLTLSLGPDCQWLGALLTFLEAPPGVFENVEPNDLTLLQVICHNVAASVQPPGPNDCSALRVLADTVELSCALPSRYGPQRVQFRGALRVFLSDRVPGVEDEGGGGWVLIATLLGLEAACKVPREALAPVITSVQNAVLQLAFCPDSIETLATVCARLGSLDLHGPSRDTAHSNREQRGSGDGHVELSGALEDVDRGFPPKESPSWVQAVTDDGLMGVMPSGAPNRVASRVLAAAKKVVSPTIRQLLPQGLRVIDDSTAHHRGTTRGLAQNVAADVHICGVSVTLGLYEGYDWMHTRQRVEIERRAMRRKLQKIRQMLSEGQPADAQLEADTSDTLFNSIHLGLASSHRPRTSAELLLAIDDELGDDADELGSSGSWESLRPGPGQRGTARPHEPKHHRDLRRSRQPALEVHINGLAGHVHSFRPQSGKHIGVLLLVDDLAVVDNLRTSTWRKFLTELRPSEGGVVRATDTPMAKIQFCVFAGEKAAKSQEASLKIKLSPLRLYVDQDAIDFLKMFAAFSSHPPEKAEGGSKAKEEALFFRHVEVHPVRIKLDYKPKRVDFQALREGRAIELMNFFHFEGSDMTLRRAVLTGVAGPDRIGEILQDIWTPDVKANQLADVISGIAPVRSVVNVGSGVADLVLLPLEQLRKDGRLGRGIQKGTTSFARSTALEAIKLGARLATGTQVVLEKAEKVLGARISGEVRGVALDSMDGTTGEGADPEIISRYADQPRSAREGVKVAYKNLEANMRATAQTILAVPLEVFNEGSGRAVVKAVPIAVLHPMVGASGALSKALLGLRQTMDPGASANDADKYKRAPRAPRPVSQSDG